MKDLKQPTAPKGNELTAKNEHYRNNMHDVLDGLRDACPYKDDTFQRWVVTSHKATRKLFANPGAGRDWEVSSEGTWGDTVTSRGGKFGMVDSDGAEHRRLRGPVSRAFTISDINRLKPNLEKIADELIAGLKDKDQFDFIEELAAPLPTIIMAEVLGVDKKDQADFKRWSDEWVFVCDPDLTEEDGLKAAAASEALQNYFAKIVDERIVNPTDDLISRVIHESGENMLSKEEIVTICLQLIVAGNITSADLIGNGIVALLQNPEQMALLRNDMSLIPQAAEEMLRFDAPVTEIPRFLAKDVEVNDTVVEQGQTLTLNLAGANHDPEVYECPHKFDIERKEVRHHAFGGGAHHCLGVHLARLEIQITFKKLLEAFPKLSLVDQELERKTIPTFSGYKKIIVATN